MTTSPDRTACTVVAMDLSTLDELGLAEVVVLDPDERPAIYLAEHRDIPAILTAFGDDTKRVDIWTESLSYAPTVTTYQEDQ